MADKFKVLRSNVAGARPTGKETGEIYLNMADKVMGFIDAAGAAVDLRPAPLSTENVISVASAATGTITLDALTQSILYYTAPATANWTLAIRGNATTTLDSILAIGQSLTVTFMATIGATSFFGAGLTIDGTAITPKWQSGTAPVVGNTNCIDAYTYTIIKTAASTFTVLATQTHFR